ncbi:hypothetical protein GOBAR_DD21036 [Gossypium barbadense]|nr:hypothetical protein GOBAR_DD21036 [Gossypium barbadense]
MEICLLQTPLTVVRGPLLDEVHQQLHFSDSSFSFSGNRSATWILKKKKLKINVHRPVGTRVVFDEEGNTQAPLAMLADKTSGDILLDQDIEGVVEDSISSSWKSQG